MSTTRDGRVFVRPEKMLNAILAQAAWVVSMGRVFVRPREVLLFNSSVEEFSSALVKLSCLIVV